MATSSALHALISAPGTKVLTVSWLSKEMGIMCAEARNMMSAFLKEHPKGSFEPLYAVIGTGLEDAAQSFVVSIVSEDQLEETKSKLGRIMSVELYGLQASGVLDPYGAAARLLAIQAKTLTFDAGAKGQRFKGNANGGIVANVTFRDAATRPAPSQSAVLGGGGSRSLGNASGGGATIAGSLGAGKKPGMMAAFMNQPKGSVSAGSSSAASAGPSTAPVVPPAGKMASFFGKSTAAPAPAPAPVDKKKSSRAIVDDDDDDGAADAAFDHAAFDLEMERKREEEATAKATARAAGGHGPEGDDEFDMEEDDEAEEEAGVEGAGTKVDDAAPAPAAGSKVRKPRKPKAVGENGEAKPRKPRGPAKPKVAKYATFMDGDEVVGGGAELITDEANKQSRLGFRGGPDTEGQRGPGRKKKLVEKAFVDDKGFFVIEKVWEDEGDDEGMDEATAPPVRPTAIAMMEDSDEETDLLKIRKKNAAASVSAPAPSSHTVPSSAPVQAAAKPAAPVAGTKQAGLMGFFGKK